MITDGKKETWRIPGVTGIMNSSREMRTPVNEGKTLRIIPERIELEGGLS